MDSLPLSSPLIESLSYLAELFIAAMNTSRNALPALSLVKPAGGLKPRFCTELFRSKKVQVLQINFRSAREHAGKSSGPPWGRTVSRNLTPEAKIVWGNIESREPGLLFPRYPQVHRLSAPKFPQQN